MTINELLSLKPGQQVIWENAAETVEGWVIDRGYNGITVEFKDGLKTNFTRIDPADRLEALKMGKGKIWETKR